ncbi:MAG: hypothetical protein H6807_09675 [Planctomycetes bacterium]|nr:hypothetical protein [Planctomycetota bacterium]
MKTFLVLIALLALAPHGELDEQIRELDRRIAAEPSRLDLRLRRGELHRIHGDARSALVDFDFVLGRDPDQRDLHFFRALALRDLDRSRPARRELDRHLAARPDHPEAWRLAAELAESAGDLDRALRCWQRLFALPAPVSPDDALRWAALARRSATTERTRGEELALAALERALERLGPAVAIEIEAARCEARLDRLEAFEARFARISRGLPRRDWFDRTRARILAEVAAEKEEKR